MPLMVCALTRALPSHIQNEALEPTPPGWRKVVVATNIAETSLTIEGIRHVIDTGVVNEPNFIPATGFKHLRKCPISKSSAIQRQGRAGRTAPGKCYRLYTQEEFE